MNISCFIVWVRSRLMWNPSSLMLLIHVRLNGDLNRYPSTDDGISQMRGKWMSRVQQVTDIYVKVWNNVNNHAVIAWLIHILNRSADIGCLQTPRSSPAWGVIFGMLRCGGFKMNQLCESFILHAKSQPRAIRQYEGYFSMKKSKLNVNSKEWSTVWIEYLLHSYKHYVVWDAVEIVDEADWLEAWRADWSCEK